MLNDQKIMECMKITQEAGKGWGGEGGGCHPQSELVPCLFQQCQHSKAAATKIGGAGEGGSAPPEWERAEFGHPEQGSVPAQRCHPTGDTLGVPNSGGPTV